LKIRSWQRTVLVSLVISGLLLAGTWALIPLVQVEQAWRHRLAQCLSVPYWTFSLAPAMVLRTANFLFLDALPMQQVPPPSTTLFLSPGEVRQEIKAGLLVTVVGAFLYAGIALLLARRRKLARMIVLALCGGWAMTCVLIVSASGVFLHPVAQSVLWMIGRPSEAAVRAIGQAPPFSAPGSSPMLYPYVVDAVGIYTLVSAALWFVVIAAAMFVARRMRVRR
jgi:hypothetical protein